MGTGASTTDAEASAPAAGYYYQIRYGLFRAIQKLKKHPTASVSLEKLDDVAIEYASGEVDLEQLKHSLIPTKEFSDTAPPLWRTLGNWSRRFAREPESLAEQSLIFTTTGQLKKGSVWELLSDEPDKDDILKVETALLAVAGSSTNKATANDRGDFVALPTPLRRALLRSITFVENAPHLGALDDEVEEHLHYACESSELPDFRKDLEGWWFDQVASNWAKGTGATIPLLSLDARISFLRERYKQSSLSFDVGDQVAMEPLDGRNFVLQIQAIKGGPKRIQNAQNDFLKATAQRSKWVRDLKIDPAELNSYDHSLTDRWKRKSAALEDELAENACEDDKCKHGRSLLAWAEGDELPIRNAKAQFLTSGSYHALADDLVIGWHPEYVLKFSK